MDCELALGKDTFYERSTKHLIQINIARLQGLTFDTNTNNLVIAANCEAAKWYFGTNYLTEIKTLN
jgi:hypothetical protein